MRGDNRPAGTAYYWRNVPIGGGGYVTGLVVHPAEPGLVFIRTDVGGAYRWDPESPGWTALTDWIPFEARSLYSIDGLALDPQDPEVVYLAAGTPDPHPPEVVHHTAKASRWPDQDYTSDVLVSRDRGRTWTRTGLNRRNLGNQAQRWAGESLAIDPHDSLIIYAGTRYDGLWVSRDGARSWLPVPGVPIERYDPAVQRGVRCLAFDLSTVEGGVTRTVYAGVIGHGVWRSEDGGAAWARLEGSPENPQRLVVAPDGALYVTSRGGDRRGLYRYRDGAWAELSPEPGEDYLALAVDPHDPAHLLVGRSWWSFRNTLYRSTDGGETWTNLSGGAVTYADVPWWPQEYFSSATSSIAFDPHQPGRVFFSDWYGVWITDDIGAARTRWYTRQRGHEEMVVFSVVSTPVGARLFTALADNDGMRHKSLADYPAGKYGGPRLSETTSLDFMEADPNIMARVGGWGWGERGSGGTSRDNGRSWTEFEGYPQDEEGKRLPGGRIAVSATPDPRTGEPTLLYLPYRSAPYRSADGGRSWQEVALPADTLHQHWTWAQPLASDRVDGESFYFYHRGRFYSSADRGETWQEGAALPESFNGHVVKAAPGIAGEVWVGLYAAGLYRSSDGGATFRRLEGVDTVVAFGFGKGALGLADPAVYLYGRVGGESGLFRSTDLGVCWTRINDDRQALGNNPKDLIGDRQVFGIVYLGSGGRGVYVGSPEGVEL